MEETPNFSDIDGLSPYAGTCVFCGLNVHQEYLISKLCRNCRRLFMLIQFSKTFNKLLFPAVAIGVFLFFIPDYRSKAIWAPVLALLPNVIIGGLQKQIIFYGISNEQKVLPMIRYSKKLKDPTYIDKALQLMETEFVNMSETLKTRVIQEVVDSIILNIKPNPPGLFSKMAVAMSMNESEFVSYLFKNTNFKDAFKQVPGTGTIPDVWTVATDEDKSKMLDLLTEDLLKEPYANVGEKNLLLEDLYLMDEEIVEFIGEEKKWKIILDELDNFEAEEPPKNVFAEARRTAEAQAKLQELSG